MNAKERFEDIKSNSFTQHHHVDFLISLVEAAISEAARWKYCFRDISRGRMKDDYMDEIWQEISERIAKG